MSNWTYLSHCGTKKCIQTHKDGDGKDVTIECCKECRCEKKGINMPKMRLFKFWNAMRDEKEKEAISLKKAIMSVQSDFKDKMISVEYISKGQRNVPFNIHTNR